MLQDFENLNAPKVHYCSYLCCIVQTKYVRKAIGFDEYTTKSTVLMAANMEVSTCNLTEAGFPLKIMPASIFLVSEASFIMKIWAALENSTIL